MTKKKRLSDSSGANKRLPSKNGERGRDHSRAAGNRRRADGWMQALAFTCEESRRHLARVRRSPGMRIFDCGMEMAVAECGFPIADCVLRILDVNFRPRGVREHRFGQSQSAIPNPHRKICAVVAGIAVKKKDSENSMANDNEFWTTQRHSGKGREGLVDVQGQHPVDGRVAERERTSGDDPQLCSYASPSQTEGSSGIRIIPQKHQRRDGQG